MKNLNAKWIWISDSPKPEEYVFFENKFSANGGKITLKICAETEYVAYINGTFLGFGQFAGYPFEKYYDEYDITDKCKDGENVFNVTVRYEGLNTLTHVDDGACLKFSILCDGKEIAFSDENTLCCPDNRYVQHNTKLITTQLGASSFMKQGENVPENKAVVIEKCNNILPRPVKKAEFVCFEEGKCIGNNLYDMGRETAGYLKVKVRCKKTSDIKIAYGEHIDDGCVRYLIGNRDFSLDFRADEGDNEFTQYFVRIAGRYLEVFASEDVEILSIGVLHYLYPFEIKENKLTGLDKQIYDTSVRTLCLSANYHYEDCPWREQALYVVDSRNQMLCGYHAFKGHDFQRANLVFMSKGIREDGFFELTFPAVNTPSIPFFTVMYPVAVYEYVKNTNDLSILDEVMPSMVKIMDALKKRVKSDGLLYNFEKPFWNFFEWSQGCSGYLGSDLKDEEIIVHSHVLLNFAYIYSGERFVEMCKMAGIDYEIDFDATRNAVIKTFFNEETGLFINSTQEQSEYSRLTNAFALLTGFGDERTFNAVKNCEGLIPATLSMLGYIYDALLAVDFEKGKEFILADIRKNYSYMLEKGATSFWETIDGAEAFHKAGSLCHGWSAMPVYYYHLFGMC